MVQMTIMLGVGSSLAISGCHFLFNKMLLSSSGALWSRDWKLNDSILVSWRPLGGCVILVVCMIHLSWGFLSVR